MCEIVLTLAGPRRRPDDSFRRVSVQVTKLLAVIPDAEPLISLLVFR